MKKGWILPLSAVLISALFGCSQVEPWKPQMLPKQSLESGNRSELREKKEIHPSEPLIRPGQITKINGFGTFELLYNVHPFEEVHLSPLKIDLDRIKIFKVTDITSPFREDLKKFGWKGNKAAYMVQIEYSIENPGDAALRLEPAPFQSLVLSGGGQATGRPMQSDSDSRFEGKGKKNRQFIWFVLDRKPGKVRSLRLTTGKVYNLDAACWHGESKRVEIFIK
ncbi:MAG: hypothetical protein CW342_01665 [Thermoactinomycetaceae bacterium]|jgi:hypothetical protein|nr:hypothetical protein [Bacillota bacterium]MBO2531601.1 hypothetical protein [Thermoactinomycetaceae bacterium]